MGSLCALGEKEVVSTQATMDLVCASSVELVVFAKLEIVTRIKGAGLEIL